MRRTVVAVLVSIAATVSPGAALAVRSGRHSSCSPAEGSQTVAQDRLVRVYSTWSTTREGGIYACLYRDGHTATLVRPGADFKPGPRLFALEGTVVAYANEEWHTDWSTAQVRIDDVATGRSRTVDAWVSRPSRYHLSVVEVKVSVTDLILTSGGTVVWICARGSPMDFERPGFERLLQVDRMGLSGATTPPVLDEGGAIEEQSLHRGLGTVTWIDNGRTLVRPI
jgi:hypothetical protein